MSVQHLVRTSPLEGEEMATAHLDAAHRGDIVGAFGTVRQNDFAARNTWVARLLTLLAIIGPGLIVMVGDNDAGGVATYAQAGQNFGTSLLWVLLLLIPVLIVNQEMVVRLGIVTGVGQCIPTRRTTRAAQRRRIACGSFKGRIGPPSGPVSL
jgi:hypothetical protein